MIMTSVPLMAVNSFAASSDFEITEIKNEGVVMVSKYTGSASYVVIPDGVTQIGEFAFLGCNTVETVYIPKSVIRIGFDRLVSNAFVGCSSLKEIIVADDNAYYSSGNGILFNKGKTTLYYYPAAKSGYSYTIPQSVTAISSHAFDGAKKLVEVNIPSNVRELNDGIFDSCSSLKSVTIGSGCTFVSPYMFKNCTSLENVTIPNSVTEIYQEAFRGCTSLKSIVIPNSVNKIDYYSFVNCPSLEFVYIPASVTEIDEGAFGYSEYDNKMSNFNIYGIKGTVAEKYANSNGFKFTERLFPDTPNGEWYYNAISFNVERGYFRGYANGYFGPGNNIQRQDFVVVLSKIAGVDLSAYAGQNGGFSDVPKNDYYSSAVAWAKDNHILSGYANGKFGVGDPITREQACLIFFNYITGYCDMGVGSSSAPEEICSRYPDGNAVSDWARTAVAWAAENHVVGGNGKLNPAGNANRAEMAQIIMNMSNNGIL